MIRVSVRAKALSVLFAAAAATLPAVAGGDAKLKKPALTLRSSPRFAFSPARVLFVAELSGGDDVEEFYCPELEWEWDDGSKSVQEADCDPFVAGQTKIERRFTATHLYKTSGIYLAKVTLRKAGRAVAAQTIKVTVRPGVGDQTLDRY